MPVDACWGNDFTLQSNVMFVTGDCWQEDDHIDKICLSWSPLQSRPSVSHADPANVKHGLDVKSVWSPDCLGLGKMLHTLTLECCGIELWFSGGQRPKPSAKCTRWFFAASFVRSQGPRITSNPPYSQKGPMGWKLFIASHQLQEGDYLQPKVGAKSRPKNALHSASAGKGFSNRGSFGNYYCKSCSSHPWKERYLPGFLGKWVEQTWLCEGANLEKPLIWCTRILPPQLPCKTIHVQVLCSVVFWGHFRPLFIEQRTKSNLAGWGPKFAGYFGLILYPTGNGFTGYEGHPSTLQPLKIGQKCQNLF